MPGNGKWKSYNLNERRTLFELWLFPLLVCEQYKVVRLRKLGASFWKNSSNYTGTHKQTYKHTHTRTHKHTHSHTYILLQMKSQLRTENITQLFTFSNTTKTIKINRFSLISENIFVCLFSVNNTISVSRHEHTCSWRDTLNNVIRLN